jgi:cytochrome bd-type quinol oxidase subunit 2
MVFAIILSIVILSGISYLAISRRSSPKIRLASLAALAVMIITVIICLFRIFMTPPAAKVQQYPDMPVEEAVSAPPNIMGLVLFVVILLALFLVVLFFSLREQRRAKDEEGGLKARLGF